ncbi:MAG: hypothetical protein KIT17_00620 [Rubrivivax sp.]|nr:hypothetical protein [Rubrivivax sp.]
MARKPRDADGAADRAREALRTTADAEVLRVAQATLLPLLGLSLDETAQIIGRDRWWVSRARNRFLRGKPPPKHGGRRRGLFRADEELELVKLAVRQAGRLLFPGSRRSVRGALRNLMDKRTPSPAAESTITDMLNRVAPRVIPGATGRHLEALAFHLSRLWDVEAELAARRDRSKQGNIAS